MDIIAEIRNEVIALSRKQYEVENYDYWGQHISLVVKYALELSARYNANPEIVELGALLHDIALVKGLGKKEHHITGVEIAKEILGGLRYDTDKTEQVLNCILNHRRSANAVTQEQLCVADADILAHFANIPMMFFWEYKKSSDIAAVRGKVREYLENDFAELSAGTRELFQNSYDEIMRSVFGELKI